MWSTAAVLLVAGYHLPTVVSPPRARTALPMGPRAHARMEAFSFDPFDRDVFRILMDAQSEARGLGSQSVGTQHLLLAATLQRDDVQASLERSGVTEKSLREALKRQKAATKEKAWPPLLDASEGSLQPAATAKDELLPFGKDTERALKATVKRSAQNGARSRDELIQWRELILTVLSDDAADAGAKKVLGELKVAIEKVYTEVDRGERELVGAGSTAAKGTNSTLAQCSVDLTQKARDGLLDPLIGVRRMP